MPGLEAHLVLDFPDGINTIELCGINLPVVITLGPQHIGYDSTNSCFSATSRAGDKQSMGKVFTAIKKALDGCNGSFIADRPGPLY